MLPDNLLELFKRIILIKFPSEVHWYTKRGILTFYVGRPKNRLGGGGGYSGILLTEKCK